MFENVSGLKSPIKEKKLQIDLKQNNPKSLIYIVGAQKRSHQNVPQWHIGYSELNLLKKWSKQGGH